MLVTMFTAGVALFLLGLIGRVEAYQIKAGTNNIFARIILGLIGLYLMGGAAMAYQLEKEKEMNIQVYQQLRGTQR